MISEKEADVVAGFWRFLQHPQKFEVCEVEGELFVRPLTKARWIKYIKRRPAEAPRVIGLHQQNTRGGVDERSA